MCSYKKQFQDSSGFAGGPGAHSSLGGSRWALGSPWRSEGYGVAVVCAWGRSSHGLLEGLGLVSAAAFGGSCHWLTGSSAGVAAVRALWGPDATPLPPPAPAPAHAKSSCGQPCFPGAGPGRTPPLKSRKSQCLGVCALQIIPLVRGLVEGSYRYHRGEVGCGARGRPWPGASCWGVKAQWLSSPCAGPRPLGVLSLLLQVPGGGRGSCPVCPFFRSRKGAVALLRRVGSTPVFLPLNTNLGLWGPQHGPQEAVGGLGGPLTPCSCASAEPGLLCHGDRDPQRGQVLTHQRTPETAPRERSCFCRRGPFIPTASSCLSPHSTQQSRMALSCLCPERTQ